MNIADYRSHQNEKQDHTCCCTRRSPWELQPDRKILIGTPDKNIPNNKVETSKYNVITFLPKNSLAQFSKTSNLYFLLLGVFQILPAVTTTEGQPTVYLPLSFIVLVSMIKDFFEDFKRHQADEEENSREVQKYSLRTAAFEYEKWQNVHVGDILRIANKQRIPADIIVLATSKNSECFVETKNLDGETNLKPKYAHQGMSKIYKHLNSQELPYSLFVMMDFERQNPLMYKFKGSFMVEQDQQRNSREVLSYENFIERGCSLQNTDWILAVVVYSGHDTKIMMNSVTGKIKYSSVEKAMGKQILWVFLVLILQCLFASTYYNVWYEREQYNLQEYLQISGNDPENDSVYNFFLRFAMWFLLMGNCVPISLLVTLETVKFFQALMIQADQNYVFQERHAAVHSSNLSEELGCIEYIFSDKTGTLTQNIMKFKSISIDGLKYGLNNHINNNDDDIDNSMDEKLGFNKQQACPQRNVNVEFDDPQFMKKVGQAVSNKEEDNVYLSMVCLSICHTIQTEFGAEMDDEIVYNASSPDELALVSFAAEIGFKYIGKTEQMMKVFIKQNQQVIQYQLMQVIEFNSTRKRMSVIVKDETGRLLLFCKGADNVIFSMLEDMSANDLKSKNILYETKRQLQEYATKGLRTLVLGYKQLDPREYDKFISEYNRAASILDDDQLRESLLWQLEETIETNLILLAATAIEDKLQDKVGEVIADLKQAGINVWVLTGDKVETAINIGYSCQLLTESVKQFIIDGELEAAVDRQISKANTYLENNPDQQISLIVSGVALIIIIHNYQNQFFKLALQANAVMACRVSPKQKQEVVNLVRRLTGKITLAIGDGANDVAMITQAHVGVGIRGLEGQQAAKASDYAIGEFKQLRRLLLYTGHESYRRNTNLILFNFYKNQLYIGVFFYYGFTNGFSGQNLYDQWLSQIFNVFFTSLPIILYALFDESYPTSDYLQLISQIPNQLESRPDLYKKQLNNPIFTLRTFWHWFFWGFLQAILLMILTFYAFEPISPHSDGQSAYYLESGMTIMGAVVYIVNIRVIILHNTNYPILVFINILSSVSYILFYLLFSQYTYFESYDLFGRTFTCPNFYIATILMMTVTNLFDLGSNRYNHFSINQVPQLREIEMSCEQ